MISAERAKLFTNSVLKKRPKVLDISRLVDTAGEKILSATDAGMNFAFVDIPANIYTLDHINKFQTEIAMKGYFFDIRNIVNISDVPIVVIKILW